jgi:hypothetical protein
MTSELMYRRSTVITIWSLLLAGSVYLYVFEPGKTGSSLLLVSRAYWFDVSGLWLYSSHAPDSSRSLRGRVHAQPAFPVGNSFSVVCVASL